MSADEERLHGGNVAGAVVRIGSTVRKPATVATPAVRAFLDHLQAVGFDGAPRHLGLDAQGRQVLTFVPGAVWDRERRHTAAELRRVGALIRSLHEAAATFCPGEGAEWDPLSPSASPPSAEADGQELICHNDLAPWNLICAGNRCTFVDWDNAAPGTRLWDLAWAAISFPPVEPGGDLATAGAAMRALVDGYGLEPSDCERLLELMVRRARAASDLLVEGARTGREPWARLHAEGHNRYWGPVADYIACNRVAIVEAMAAGSPQRPSACDYDG